MAEREGPPRGGEAREGYSSGGVSVHGCMIGAARARAGTRRGRRRAAGAPPIVQLRPCPHQHVRAYKARAL